MLNVRQFVYDNITPYDGDASFLCRPTEKTITLRNEVKELFKKEFANGGVLAIDTKTVSTITSHKAGYIDKSWEMIVGFQTDEPLKRAVKPFGGRRVVEKACQENKTTLDPEIKEIFQKYRKSHNDGIFDAYTDKMKLYRSVGILTGLPDNYARGRIIGDYRRVALYGIDTLIKEKEADKQTLVGPMTEDVIRLREEVSEQIRALQDIKTMAAAYGIDISKPASTAQEAVQRVYFGYLAAVKEQDGAAMSLGNVSSFLDIYIEKDLKTEKITEAEAQELIDHLVMKLRMVRQLRMGEYNTLFAGDPTWVTESLGWCFKDGKHKVTKTSYRFLQTLYNLGSSPEPNITVLRSDRLPHHFKEFCAKVSIDSSTIQYENDDLMREVGECDDYGIACCVSQLEIGKRMQFFWARSNLAKALLYSINEGKDELEQVQVFDDIPKLKNDINLDYEEVKKNYFHTLDVLAREYVDTMNIIHYMHDKYYYEKSELALMDTHVTRLMAFGAAGLSVVADSLSAIKYAKVKAIRNGKGIAIDFETTGDYPKFWNDDDRVDSIAQEVIEHFIQQLRTHHIYRDATPTLSLLTITSNVVYGHKTGITPDGRKVGEALAPGASPMHGRDVMWAIASLNSVAKLDYHNARDGISNTFSVVPPALGSTPEEKIQNLITLLHGYFSQGAQHLNVNVLNKETLLKAMEHPEEYPQLTIRVSGYAVNFVKLTREQQLEVISRTFHEKM